jgi:putative heme-binding domain-containing protein
MFTDHLLFGSYLRRSTVRKRRPAVFRPLVTAVLAVCSGIGLLAQNQPQAAGHGEYERADIERGFGIYSTRCVTCHGPAGDGVPGIDFRSGRFKNASTDDDLRRVITTGVAGTPMPAGSYQAPELTALVAFLRSIKEFDARTVAIGDQARGRQLVEGKGQCLTCHRIGGRGSLRGPDLSAIGSVRTAAALQQALVDPAAALLPTQRSVRIVTRNGTTMIARRLNEDTHSVQVISAEGQLLSLQKDSLQEYSVLTEPLMPGYRDRLQPAELADIVAYLNSLKP